jgi:hypothetical protein
MALNPTRPHPDHARKEHPVRSEWL